MFRTAICRLRFVLRYVRIPSHLIGQKTLKYTSSWCVLCRVRNPHPLRASGAQSSVSSRKLRRSCSRWVAMFANCVVRFVRRPTGSLPQYPIQNPDSLHEAVEFHGRPYGFRLDKGSLFVCLFVHYGGFCSRTMRWVLSFFLCCSGTVRQLGQLPHEAQHDRCRHAASHGQCLCR